MRLAVPVETLFRWNRNNRKESGLVVTFCAAAILTATLVGLLAPDSPATLVATSMCVLAAALILVRRAARLHLRTAQTLCVLFFMLAVAHVVSGYFFADLTTEHTSIRSNAQAAFATALLVNSIGIFAGAVGYAWKIAGCSSGRIAAIPIEVDQRLAGRIFSLLAAFGAVLMFLVYWKLNVLDLLAVPSQWAFMRYITSDTLNGSATDEWLVNRAMDLLTVSLPLVLFRIAKRPRFSGIVLALVGYLALLLPLRRANLIGVTLAFLILWGISRGNAYRFTRKMIMIAGAIYLASQCLFLLAAFEGELAPEQVLTISSTAFPELRDLAWTTSLLNGERLHGVTFAQALLPVPSIVSDWSSTHSLRYITTKLIGMDESRETGGLRLTILGEGYINFGYFGAIAAGFVWGMAVGWCEKLLAYASALDSEFWNYAAVLCFVWVCFLVYLAGTQAAASIKTGAFLLLAVAWASKYRPVSREVGMVAAT
jgi:hypothetical protein